MTYSFDLIVIGSGPAGQKGAIAAAKAGKKVAIVENDPAVGGGCVHVGTLPSKSLRESVYRWSLSSQGTLGQEASRASPAAKKHELPELQRLIHRRERVVSVEAQVVSDQLKRNRVEIIQGRGKLVSPHEVEVDSSGTTRIISGEYILIATGAEPVAPGHLPVDGLLVHDSNTILSLRKLPREMVVLGGGIIGCEYASMFSMAGTKVYLVDKRHEILASVDREIVDHLGKRFVHEGMELVLETECKKLEMAGGGKGPAVTVHLANGRQIGCDVVLVCLGRRGNSRNLGLENVGLQADERGLIQVDQNFRTQVPSIYAAGDVIGAPALASTSMEQGRLATCHAFQIENEFTRPGVGSLMEFSPYGIYTIPEISLIGMTEEDCASKKVDAVVGRAHYRELARGQIVGDQWGLLKIMVDRKSLGILGVHIVGDNAAELVHIGQAVMAFGGDVTYFIRSVFNYPTLAEAYKTAAFDALNQLRGTASKKKAS